MQNSRTILPISIFMLCIASLLFSCKKDKDKTAGDVEGPMLIVYDPDNNNIYSVGDTIFLTAHLEDDSEMQDFTVKLFYGLDSLLIWPTVPGILGNIKSYDLDAYYKDVLPISSPAFVRFKASDKHNNQTVVDVAIQLEL